MQRYARAVIINGGCFVAAVLCGLMKRGWSDVASLERTQLKAGHALGLILIYAGEIDIGWMIRRTIEGREAETRHRISWHKCGQLRIVNTRECFDEDRSNMSVVEVQSNRAELVLPDEARELWPLLENNTSIPGALTLSDDGHIAPRDATLAMVRGAHFRGANIHPNIEVGNIERLPSADWKIRPTWSGIIFNAKIRVKPGGRAAELTDVTMFDETTVEEALRLTEAARCENLVVVSIDHATVKVELRPASVLAAQPATLTETGDHIEALTRAKFPKSLASIEPRGLIIVGKQAIDDDSDQSCQKPAALMSRLQAARLTLPAKSMVRARHLRRCDDGIPSGRNPRFEYPELRPLHGPRRQELRAFDQGASQRPAPRHNRSSVPMNDFGVVLAIRSPLKL